MSGAGQFEALGIMPELVRSLRDELHWDLPRAIQEESIPLILGGGDVLAAAETGSGKTGAFALPMVQIVYETLRELALTKASSEQSVTSTATTARLSGDDKELQLNVSADGLRAQSRLEEKWAGGRASWGLVAGQYYYEVYCADEGLSRVGWSLSSATFNLGTDDKSYGYGGTGKKSHRKQFDNYGVAYGRGNTVGCFVDLEDGTIHFSVDGKEFPTAFPIKGKQAMYPALVLKNAELHLNFGDSPFKYPPPAPYRGVSEAPTEHTTLKSVGSLDTGRPPLALIIEPSRELAEQTHAAIETFLRYMPPPAIRCALMTGGSDAKDSLRDLRGGVDIVTGTIGRIEALLTEGKLSLKNIRFFVLDEADKLMDSDNFQSIVSMYERIPKEDRSLQVLMFSATLHSTEIKNMAKTICRFPQWVDLKGTPSVPENVDHAILWVDPTKVDVTTIKRSGIVTDGVHARDSGKEESTRLSEAVKVLKVHYLGQLINGLHIDQALIFTRTRLDADHVHSYLRSLDGGGILGTYSSMVLHAGKNQDDRRRALDAFKKGDVRFLVSTDVAARGIDIESLPYVINFTLPERPEDYIHRIGRTGRSDKIGLALSLVSTVQEKVWYHTCPNRGKSCSNTKLVAEGGCTVWYDEPTMVRTLEALISKPIPVMTASNNSLSLPDFGRTTQYGSSKASLNESAENKQHLLYLKPVVEQLTLLETDAQKSFLNLRLRYGTSSSGIINKKK